MSQGEFFSGGEEENLLKVHVDVNYEFIVPCETIESLYSKIPPCGCFCIFLKCDKIIFLHDFYNGTIAEQ